MTSVRVSVEWMFGSICNYFALIDMKKQQEINLSAFRKIYIVFSLLQNAHTCLYGHIVSLLQLYSYVFHEEHKITHLKVRLRRKIVDPI